ncbi:LRR receptor-like serine/threonine-protein kinase GHR1 isoform X2 [Cryptomeria japonica]|uniref:LRR receptor-like serine/threonine-protein kinase GHR1 isoform X2 n=1 Tax=Cryptomeria japonica TaxID=3369 RepID=UPI0027D9D6D0|nr:LRR receptor-like serine/threonine-protein kinase GHR1 isoform X2 [Cryptomeria japonica]
MDRMKTFTLMGIAAFVFCFGLGMAQVLSEDALVLLEFKKGIHKDPLGHVSSWDEKSVVLNGCPTSWYGVVCSDGFITGIDLSSLNIAGEINLGIFSKLKRLQNLSLFNNSLTGNLSAELGTLGSIQYIDLSDNLFYGSIPGEIGNLQNLQNLSFAGNKFTGIIPDSVGAMSSLLNLDLSRNSLNGQMPTTLSKLQDLVSLNLSLNKLSGGIPAGVEKFLNLKNLDLHQNQLSGQIESSLMLLMSAEYIDLSCNLFSGQLPWKMQIIASLTQSLRYLNLSNNRFTGLLQSDDSIPLFDSLKVLDISSNQLTGELPAFHFVYALEVLRLSNNRFSGFVPFTLLAQDSSVLVELDLSHNNLSGPLGVITSTTLRILNISSNSLSGPLPSKTGTCAVMDLSNNVFTGDLSVLQTWGNSMQVLDLSCNQITGSVPNETSQFLRLTHLNLSHNALVGPLPSILGTYPKLNVLDLSFNHLSGFLLTSLFSSSTLSGLHLASNRFTGTIPLQTMLPVSPASSSAYTPYLQYSRLESLDLSSNQLNGSIPVEIGFLESLRELNLHGNNFLRSIPSEISKLGNLSYLDLSVNHLTGHIPPNLPNSLKELNLSYNNLLGTVPQNLRRFPELSFHPGNVQLIFPHIASPSNGVPNRESNGSHAEGLKPGHKALIIGGCAAGAAILIALALFLHHRRVSNSQDLLENPEYNKQVTRADDNKGSTSSARHFDSYKNADCTEPVSVSLSVDDPIASKKESPVAALKAFSSEPALRWPSDVKLEGVDSAKLIGSALSPPKIKWSSPGSNSHLSSSPRSEDSFTPDHPVILKVRSPDRLAGELYILDQNLVLTAEELSRAPAEVLGRSSHGTSYKATLDNGHLLRVKWLREGLAKCRKDFTREAKKFGNIKHPNIISLRGYYWGPSEHEKLILSDFMSSGSLVSHMYGLYFLVCSRLSTTIDIKHYITG